MTHERIISLKTRNEFYHASVSVGAAAVQLSATSKKLQQGVAIKAAAANTGKVYVGFDNTVTADTNAATDGFELSASEALELEIDDISSVYLIGSAAGQKVFYIAV